MTENVSLPDYDLTGKTAFLTGATSGLGRHFALVLARAGARVAVTGRRVDQLEELVAEIEEFDGRALPMRLDVTDPESIAYAVECASTELGPLDILVNNAGVANNDPAIDVTPESYDALMDTNVKGMWFTATEVARRMIARGKGGKIINIGSIGSHAVLPGLTLYCVSKAAVAMMTRALARAWARHDICVNAICPGHILTRLNADWFKSEGGQKQIRRWPRKRLQEVHDLDGILLLLASDHSGAITGSVITVDDAQSL